MFTFTPKHLAAVDTAILDSLVVIEHKSPKCLATLDFGSWAMHYRNRAGGRGLEKKVETTPKFGKPMRELEGTPYNPTGS